MKRVDWKVLAALAALTLLVSFILLVIVSFVQPGRDVLDKIDQQNRVIAAQSARSACITDLRSGLDLAEASLLVALIDRDQTATVALRAELVAARDDIANLNTTCPKGTP